MSLNQKIQYLQSISDSRSSFIDFFSDTKDRVFSDERINTLLAWFDFVVYDLEEKILVSYDRLISCIEDLENGKINKFDCDYFTSLSKELKTWGKSLVDNFEAVKILLYRNNIDLFSDTELDNVYGEIKNKIIAIQEVSLILHEIKESFVWWEDSKYFYLSSIMTELSIVDMETDTNTNTRNSNFKQISEHLDYDINDSLLIDIQTGNEYRLGSEERIRFMKTLVDGSKNWEYVDYLKFAEALTLDRYVNWWTYGQRIPTLTWNRIREVYKWIRRSIESQFWYNTVKSNFCWKAVNGYRLPFLRK